MNEQNKHLAEDLVKAMEGLPEEVKADFQKRWTEQAIGARIVSEIVGTPG